MGGVAVFGVIVHAIADAIDNDWVNGTAGGEGGWPIWAAHWVIVPYASRAVDRPREYISLVCLALVLTLLQGWMRLALLVPVLYLAASSGRT